MKQIGKFAVFRVKLTKICLEICCNYTALLFTIKWQKYDVQDLLSLVQ